MSTSTLDSNEIASTHFSKETLAVLYAAAYEFYRNGKYEEAKTFFHLLTLSNPDDTRYWMGLGASYQLLKNYEAAISAYSVAAVQNCADPYVHLHAAECFFHQGNLPQALEALDSSLVVARDTEANETLIAKLELLHDTWSKQYSGETHD